MPGVEVFSSGNSIQLIDANDPAFPDPAALEASNGLLCAFERGGILLTGIDMGPVVVNVVALASPPPLDMNGWEEAVDVSIVAPKGRLYVTPNLVPDDPGLPALTAFGPGVYRVRCYATGRREQFKEIVETANERYLLQAWPAPSEPDTVHRLVM